MSETPQDQAQSPQNDPLFPGFKLIEEGRFDDAVTFFKEAASQHPRDWRVFAQLGQLQLSAEKHHQAASLKKRPPSIPETGGFLPSSASCSSPPRNTTKPLL